MNLKITQFIAIKLIQAAYKNFKFYLAIVLLFVIQQQQTNLGTSDNTIAVIVYLSFFSLILSKVLAWIFLQDFTKLAQAAINLPLHISGLIDFYYVYTDSTCTKPHNSLRFYISNILSLFCLPAYIIVIILNDYIYQGIETQIIYTVILLSSINEFLVYFIYGLPTACKISSSSVYYSLIQIYEIVTSMSFTGLLILNIRYSIPFLIAYFSYLPLMFILLPCVSSTFYSNNRPINCVEKALYFTTFWLCTYQFCTNRIVSKKKIFADITNKTNKFLVIYKFLFYQFPYFFFLANMDNIKGQVSNSNQIKVLFVIATVCQFKLIYDILYSFLVRDQKEIVINDSNQLQKLIKQASDKTNSNSKLERIIIKIPYQSSEVLNQILHLCLGLYEKCEVVINNSKWGRFKYDENDYKYKVKLDCFNFDAGQSLKCINEINEISEKIHFLKMKLYTNKTDKQSQLNSTTLLSKIFNSNILYFKIDNDLKDDSFYQLIQQYQSDQLKGVIHFLVFKYQISAYLTVNPAYVYFDLFDK
ncbi:transmembrane protein, putative (macronuclear) [Tetrahymena thermophila SB210]|uniref:Transmembrane protein, putative n=1 Tax=Tetrahymena thermophila (strain SB210) TaxID=312017 RepID=Q23EY1_TETTS|nr:transmembrane protein, putative [Tetrahymena thermophila SB210]EAR95124.1 transmembrane protein, putative [Tetrahymena thermophila SB210]|eukprot:XP_001015369.1 transmembrane protein, putative [Tetrahymena thermophila SB210]